MFLSVICLFALTFNFSFQTIDDSITTVLILLFLILCFNLFLGFEGVQIDKRGSKVRHYRSILGIRFGNWFPLSDFTEVVLDIDRFTVSSGTRISPKSTRHRTFDVSLLSPGHPKGILLYECKSYPEGKAKLKEVISLLGMQGRDACSEAMQASLERRKTRRR